MKKKDGSWRLCIEYRALTRRPYNTNIPVIDELMDELQGIVMLSKLDLKSEYHCILVRNKDTHKTIFRTNVGHYEFQVVPIRLTNTSTMFQSLMNDDERCFLAIPARFVLVFFNDILVYSRCQEDHVVHLKLFLEKMNEHLLQIGKNVSLGKKKWLTWVTSFPIKEGQWTKIK